MPVSVADGLWFFVFFSFSAPSSDLGLPPSSRVEWILFLRFISFPTSSKAALSVRFLRISTIVTSRLVWLCFFFCNACPFVDCRRLLLLSAYPIRIAFACCLFSPVLASDL
eukprot:TRINITY_DN33037_c0_g1_i1.p1 TRINITY_DN33037_c0_g1~~TRINITY_DN33037_c0_g1_i1.p1  ORF type:complete len:111 (+),score=1.75 TRINITY_DN33037_c0_g1_i1:380-712(+)